MTETEITTETKIERGQTQDFLAYMESSARRVLPDGWAVTAAGASASKGILELTFMDSSQRAVLTATILPTDRPTIRLSASTLADPQVVRRILTGLDFLTVEFAESMARGRLFLTFVPGRSLVPGHRAGTRRSVVERVFFGNMFGLFMLSVIASFVLLILFREFTPIALIALQVVLLLFSRDLVARMGDWTLGRDAGVAYIVEMKLPFDHLKALLGARNGEIYKVKEKIFSTSFAKSSPPTPEQVAGIWQECGIPVVPRDVRVRQADLYNTVEEVAKLYRVPTPKVVLGNTLRPNAAATGPHPRRSVVLVTTGALSLLNPGELKAIIGHELSHIRNFDMLALFSLVGAEYLIRLYLFYSGFFSALPFIGILYIFASLTVVYFIAKFLEARADLDSAYVVENASALSSALRKIGARRLFVQKLNRSLLGDWLAWDLHPPIAFRIKRLDDISKREDREVRNTLILSMRDCIAGLLSAFRGSREYRVG